MVKYIIEKLRLRAFYFGVRNLWRWFPLIWQDRQWDESYLFYILQYKLLLMEKYFASDKAVTASAKNKSKEIRVCRLLVDRILLNDYNTPFDDRDAPRFQRFAEAFEKSMHDESTDELILDREDTPLEEKVYKYKIDHIDYMEKQDIEMLLQLIAKQVTGWWD